jgi:hypothetical protein
VNCVVGILNANVLDKGSLCQGIECYKFDHLCVSFNIVTLQFSFNRFSSYTYFSVAILKILLFASLNNYFFERRAPGEGGNCNLSINLHRHRQPIYTACAWWIRHVEWGSAEEDFCLKFDFSGLFSVTVLNETRYHLLYTIILRSLNLAFVLPSIDVEISKYIE